MSDIPTLLLLDERGRIKAIERVDEPSSRKMSIDEFVKIHDVVGDDPIILPDAIDFETPRNELQGNLTTINQGLAVIPNDQHLLQQKQAIERFIQALEEMEYLAQQVTPYLQ